MSDYQWVDINEIITEYLPISRKKARKFITLYLEPKKIGNRIYVERARLEALLSDPQPFQLSSATVRR